MKYLFFFIFTISSCSCVDEFGSRARNFSIELLHHTEKKNEEVVISPFGVWSLMTSIAFGAAGNSSSQLSRALFLPSDQINIISDYQNFTKTVLNPTSEGVTLTSKNFVFIDEGFTIDSIYEKNLAFDFGTIIKKLNFKEPDSVKMANDFIQGSGARVSNVLRPNNFRQSTMILSNVVTFKGLWASSFNQSETVTESFYDENRNKLGDVNMMYQRAEWPYINIRDLNSVILEMPYGNEEKYCMIVMLPYPKIKVTDVYEKLEKTSFRDIFQKLQRDVEEFGLEEIDVKLPRFKISTNIVLNKPLNKLGVYDIFDPKLANFIHIAKEELYVSDVVHEADIEVTESGMVAATFTPSIFPERGYMRAQFEMNRPFIYFVMEKPTATVIMGGIYSKPSVF